MIELIESLEKIIWELKTHFVVFVLGMGIFSGILFGKLAKIERLLEKLVNK